MTKTKRKYRALVPIGTEPPAQAGDILTDEQAAQIKDKRKFEYKGFLKVESVSKKKSIEEAK